MIFRLPYRQVHLDFHTSEEIKGIGAKFDKKQFQEMLKLGHVSSITIFSKCHHGWAYHPSAANETHPHLSFDLLSEQIEAAHEIGVKTPVYLSAGLDEKTAKRHHEWLIVESKEMIGKDADFSKPGYHQLCMNTPYLEYLVKQIGEATRNYDADGIFLDIVGVRECYCESCLNTAKKKGIDINGKSKMTQIWETTYSNYTSSVEKVVHAIKPDMPIFHNGGHIRHGRRDLAGMNTHLELESLPTGGWGYQHFQLSARYVQQIGMDYLGMTGKFHSSWGEFGGFKHPNALTYETALCLANGAKCSIGDQLHPNGEMDYATYKLIGQAYAEVEAKEAWCSNVQSVADIALLSSEAVNDGESDADIGCVKILIECNYLFDVVDTQNDLSKYKVVILPDNVRLNHDLTNKIQNYIKDGGKVLATGYSGLDVIENKFVLDLGAKYEDESEYNPTYFMPYFSPGPLEGSSYVMYEKGHNVKALSGKEHGELQNPYFNRTAKAFCSHQHAPSMLKKASSGITEGEAGIYIAWNVFSDYAKSGSLILKEMVRFALNKLLDENISLKTNLPSQGVVTLMKQEPEKRYINHLLYASPVVRGKYRDKPIEVIEDAPAIYDTVVRLKVKEKIKRVYLAPQMTDIGFTQNEDTIEYKVHRFEIHQMVVVLYK